MKFRKSIVIAVTVTSLGTIFVPMAASAAVAVSFNVARPPARHEVVPAPRSGYVWSSGYWNAKGDRHVWQGGHWERERTGYHYAQPTWTQHDNRWQLQPAHWNRADRDGDGVPNSVDRAPDNSARH
jgi:hypothetical protein